MSSPLLLRTTDIYVDSFTYTPSANTITIGQTESYPSQSISITSFSGLTIDNNLSVGGDLSVTKNTILSGLTASTIFATTYQNLPSSVNTKNFGIVIDGGGGVIQTGIKGELISPYNMTINSWTLLADITGSTVLDIWKTTYSNYPAVSGNTIITGGTKPTLTSQISNQSISLSGWNTTINQNDILVFEVDSASSVTRLTLTLNGTIT
jgi:hypothetical protein